MQIDEDSAGFELRNVGDLPWTLDGAIHQRDFGRQFGLEHGHVSGLYLGGHRQIQFHFMELLLGVPPKKSMLGKYF